jgi:hypothetical protein
MSLELTYEERITLLVALDLRIEGIEKVIDAFRDDEDKYVFETFAKDRKDLLKLKDKLKQYDTWKTI